MITKEQIDNPNWEQKELSQKINQLYSETDKEYTIDGETKQGLDLFEEGINEMTEKRRMVCNSSEYGEEKEKSHNIGDVIFIKQ